MRSILTRAEPATAAGSPAEPPPETIEQKYNFLLGNKTLLLDWLSYSCVPDPGHPAGSIHSIYYDTPDFKHYEEKRNSDFQKSKVRLRWYGDLASVPAGKPVKCFLEVKLKFGAIRRKGRETVELPVEVLRDTPFSHPRMRSLSTLAPTFDFLPVGMLLPMAQISYNRRRFVEPRTGARIAVDTEINCPRINTAFLAGLVPARLDKGVLEIKSPHRHLLPAFSAVSAHLSKQAFSKYAECLETLVHPFERRI